MILIFAVLILFYIVASQSLFSFENYDVTSILFSGLLFYHALNLAVIQLGFQKLPLTQSEGSG